MYWCRIRLWFHLMGGLQAKSMTSQRIRATYKMADMCYYGNVMATTRWRLCVTMETLSQHSDNVYFCCWRCVYRACYRCILHLQQYSHRLNLLFSILFQMWLTMGDVTFAFGISLFLLLLVDAPFRSIEKTVLGKHRWYTENLLIQEERQNWKGVILMLNQFIFSVQ